MPTALLNLRFQSLTAAQLDGPALEQYKTDARSTVWRVDSPQGPRVVKRFTYSPLRQRLSLLLGNHPAQTEIFWNQALRDAGVPAVPLIDGGIESKGLGRTVWLATPLAGTSLQRLIRDPAIRASRGPALLRAAATLTSSLFSASFWSRDLKPSNIIIDEQGVAHLIDTGSVRRGATGQTVARTLAVMVRVLARDGVEEPLRLHFLRCLDELEKQKREPNGSRLSERP